MGFRVSLNSIEVSQHHAGEKRAKEFDTPFSDKKLDRVFCVS